MTKIDKYSFDHSIEIKKRSTPTIPRKTHFPGSPLLFLFISIYFNLFQSITTYAQTDSLQFYLETAAKNNPTVLQKFAEYNASLQKVPQVGSLPDPELSLGIFLSPMELVGGNQVADIRLMQMFPWFGVLKNAKDEMSLMAKAKYETFQDTKLQLFYDVQRTWYELNKVKQNIRISEKNIELLRTIERLAVVRFKAVPTGNSSSPVNKVNPPSFTQSASPGSPGMNTMGGNSSGSASGQAASMPGNPMGSSSGSSGLSDVYRLQIEIGELQNNIEQLKAMQITFAAQFNSYLNRSPNAAVVLPDSLIADNFQPSHFAIPDSILSNNPMLGMLQFEQESLEARKQMVTKMSYPMVGLGLNYSLINKSEMSTSPMNGKDMIMPMVTFTLPIYRKKYKAMQAEADFLKSANSQNYKATANSLQTAYYQAFQLYQDALRREKLYAAQYLLASKSLNIMFKSFGSSGSSLTDILRVRQQTLDYEYKQIEAIADYNISIAWMKRLGNIEISRNK
ncbi:MAG: TolC family protein [Prolixibacteraceae bacterium]|nr:TolC family protein [Prolixibacteraceae bacterium]